MKAVVFYDRNQIRYEENFPEPEISKPDDVKVQVHYCGICGSDLKEYKEGPIFFARAGEKNEISDKEYPHVMGHEISGEIVEVGENVHDLIIGDKVVVEVTGTCFDRDRFPDAENYTEKKCGSCSDGHYNACDYLGLTGLGFTDGGCSEYLVTSARKIVKINPSIIPMDVAALIQPLAVSWHAVSISNFKEGDSALILGGGPIGLTTIFALKGHKCGKIVVSEPAEARRLLALKLDVEVYDPIGKTNERCIEDLRKMSPDSYGFHHTFDCSGIPATFDISIKALRIRGVATNVAIWAHKAIPYFPMETTLAEKIVTGSICFVKKDFEEVVAAVESGLISVDELKLMITSIIHLEDGVEKGFDELINHKERHIKILFTAKEEFKSKK